MFECSELPYRVVIFPSKKYGPVTTTANVWVAISGSLCETQLVAVPRSSLEFVFHVSDFFIICFCFLALQITPKSNDSCAAQKSGPADNTSHWS